MRYIYQSMGTLITGRSTQGSAEGWMIILTNTCISNSVLIKRRKSNKRVRTISYCLSVSNKRCVLHEGWSDQTGEVGIRRRSLSGCRLPYRGACAGSWGGCGRCKGVVWVCVVRAWWPEYFLDTVMQVGGRRSGRRGAQAAGNPQKSVRNDVQDFLQGWATPNPVLGMGVRESHRLASCRWLLSFHLHGWSAVNLLVSNNTMDSSTDRSASRRQRSLTLQPCKIVWVYGTSHPHRTLWNVNYSGYFPISSPLASPVCTNEETDATSPWTICGSSCQLNGSPPLAYSITGEKPLRFILLSERCA
jgi:hypothetical protein